MTPFDGESLSSWIDRGAAALQVARCDIWSHVSMLDPGRNAPSGYGVDLADWRIQNLVHATSFRADTIRAMLLRRYEGIALGFDRLDLANRDSVRTWSRREWAYARGSHACARCVAETGAWRVAWKLPWSFACADHGTFLLNRCAECGTRLQVNAFDRRQATRCCASVPDDTRTRADGNPRLRRHSDDICGASIADMKQQFADDASLTTQYRLDDALGGKPAADGLDLIGELRSLLPMVLYLASPAHLDLPDGPVTDRFREHVNDREEMASRRGARATAGYRAYSITPTDPLLVASACNIAVGLVFADNLQNAWARFVDIASEAGTTTATWTQLGKFWSPPGRHQKPLRAARDHRLFAISAELDGRARRTRSRYAGVDSRHVPALLWPDAFTPLATGLFERGRPVALRRFAAIALARTLEPALSDWNRGARALGLPDSVVAQCHHLSSKLRQHHTGSLFAERVDALAELVTNSRCPLDYGARRTAFGGLRTVSAADWASVCRRSGLDPRSDPWKNRRALAAAWIWEVLTGGDWHHAPALDLYALDRHRRQMKAQAYDAYFRGKYLPLIRPALAELAAALLERDGLPGPLAASASGHPLDLTDA